MNPEYIKVARSKGLRSRQPGLDPTRGNIVRRQYQKERQRGAQVCTQIRYTRARTHTDVYFMINNLFPHKERIEHRSFTKFVDEGKQVWVL